MTLKRTWFPLLLVGFIASFLLAFYFVAVEKKSFVPRIRLVEVLSTVPLKDNGKFN